MARIYISSTFQDLEGERKRIAGVIRRLNHEPIGMEDYTAEGSRPLDKCLRDVERCQGYVGVLGWRYGFVPTDGNPDRCSITELEYRKAKQLGKEILIFLRTRKNIDADLMDAVTGEGERGALIDKLREGLRTIHTVDFFDSVEELESKATAAIAKANWGEDPVDETTQSALKHLKHIGICIVKLCIFRKVYEDLLRVYVNQPLLRSERAEDLSPQTIRAAARTARDWLDSSRAILKQWKPHFSDKEQVIVEQRDEDFELCISKLEKLGVASEAADKPVAETPTEVVEAFNQSLATFLNQVDDLAFDLWREIKLGQLQLLLEQVNPKARSNLLRRVESGYQELSNAPPHYSKCDILVREHDLLDGALENFSTLRRELEHLDLASLRLRCKAIKRKVEQAREQWRAFEHLEGKRETWEIDLLGDGTDQWETIDQCEAEIAPTWQQLEGSEGEIPPGILDKLRKARKFLEIHFTSVDVALRKAYDRVKDAIGDELVVIPVREGTDGN